jgi:hypothetical protein
MNEIQLKNIFKVISKIVIPKNKPYLLFFSKIGWPKVFPSRALSGPRTALWPALIYIYVIIENKI